MSVRIHDRVVLSVLREVYAKLGRIDFPFYDFPFYDPAIESDLTLIVSRVRAIIDVLDAKALLEGEK